MFSVGLGPRFPLRGVSCPALLVFFPAIGHVPALEYFDHKIGFCFLPLPLVTTTRSTHRALSVSPVFDIVARNGVCCLPRGAETLSRSPPAQSSRAPTPCPSVPGSIAFAPSPLAVGTAPCLLSYPICRHHFCPALFSPAFRSRHFCSFATPSRRRSSSIQFFLLS